MTEINYHENIKKIFWLNGLWMFMIIMPILVPYFQTLGLSMKNVFELQSVFSIIILLSEVPSGYISDLMGRKNTLVLACVLHGIGYSIFPFATNFWELVIAEVFLAFGVSLFSGSDISLLYDSLNEKKSSHTTSYSKQIGLLLFYKQSGEALAAIVCSLIILKYSLKAPIVIHSFIAWTPLIVALLLKEPTRKLMSKSKHRENFNYIYKSLFKDSKFLGAIVLNMIMYGVATLLAVWLFQNYWKDLGVNIFYFGFIWAALNFTVGLIGKIAHKIESFIGTTFSIILIGILPIVGYMGMGASSSYFGIIFCFTFQISRGLNQVIIKDALNKRISGDLRATANSIVSLGVRLIFITLGPLLGYFIDIRGPEFSYYFMSLLYVLIFVGILIPLLKHRKSFI